MKSDGSAKTINQSYNNDDNQKVDNLADTLLLIYSCYSRVTLHRAKVFFLFFSFSATHIVNSAYLSYQSYSHRQTLLSLISLLARSEGQLVPGAALTNTPVYKELQLRTRTSSKSKACANASPAVDNQPFPKRGAN